MSAEEVRDTVSRVLAHFDRAAETPRLKVVNRAELPADEAHVKGPVSNGVMHIVADNIESVRDLQAATYHGLFHWGVRRLMRGPQCIKGALWCSGIEPWLCLEVVTQGRAAAKSPLYSSR